MSVSGEIAKRTGGLCRNNARIYSRVISATCALPTAQTA